MNTETKYNSLYSNERHFQDEYINGRNNIYNDAYNILLHLNIESILDIGCSYGNLVENCNNNGLKAYGIDFPILELQRHHEKLNSKHNFIYGSVTDQKVADQIKSINPDCIVLLDTFRVIDEPEKVVSLSPKYFVIKEVANNGWIKKKRITQNDFRLYSPIEISRIFNGYKVHTVYSTKFIFKINRPSFLHLKLINILPTYTIILEKC